MLLTALHGCRVGHFLQSERSKHTMKKIFTLIFALVLAISSTPVSSEPTHSPETSKTPSGNIAPVLVGTWSTTNRYGWYDDSYSPNWEKGTYYAFKGYRFNNDGTFYFHFTTSGLTAVFKGTNLWRGNYSVTGDEITISNIEIQRIPFNSSPSEWESIPVASFSGYANVISLAFDTQYLEHGTIKISIVHSSGSLSTNSYYRK